MGANKLSLPLWLAFDTSGTDSRLLEEKTEREGDRCPVLNSTSSCAYQIIS